ncbi:MAG TPA: hypothetical protein VF721_10450 [Pyrinomonadaceae bacterium]|jgi:hypothetical protein
MKLKKRNLLWFVCLFCLSASVVSAQKLWDKPYQQWSKEEALKIMNSSPWSQSYQSAEGLAATDQEQINRGSAEQDPRRQTKLGSSSRNLAPPVVVIRLHSALPVRQAFVRLQQIEVGYDKWDEKKRAEFDAATKNILDCPLCKDYYIVTMAKSVNASGQGVDEGLFQTMGFEQLKGNVYLVNEKGEKRELVQFTPPKGGRDFAVFFFKRGKDKSDTFLTAENKDLKFVFDNNFMGSKNPYASLLPRSFDFKVSKLLIGEKVEF